ncbi:MAG: hypothetical protein MI742_07210 [Desulfobacterales bacterium]|nr:hypothetical protein [Desulfobacterales bacterium]
MTAARLILIFTLALLITGCSLFTPTPRFTEDGAHEEIERLESLRKEVQTFRGSGTMVLVQKGERQRFRMAWVGEAPNHLRMEILAAGTPVESLAYDGKKLMFRSQTKAHPFYTDTVKNPSLETITGVPLTLSDIHALLSGRFAVGSFKRARLIIQKNNLPLLVTRPGWSRIKRIQLDSHGRVTKASLLSGGTPTYTLELTPQKSEENTFWYKKVKVNGQDNQATLTIDRVTTGIEVPHNAFILTP